MSRATKRKHVMKEVLEDDFDLPKSEQQIVRVTASKGNNLHEVETDNGQSFLVSMPTKFRRNVWVKRGDFILVEPIAEGDKVKAEMVKVLSNEHIKYFKESNCWPSSFDKKQNSDTNDDSDLFVNTNRPPPIVMSSSDDSDSDEETKEEEEEKNEESGDED